MANACLRVRFLITAGCASVLVTGQVTTEECTNSIGGVSINGRCFFVKTEDSSWIEAWTKCAADGGTLAQIHATNEFEAIKKMLEGKGRDPSYYGFIRAWIALQRDDSSTCALTAATTYWSDAPSVKNMNMPVAYTWMRSHQCDDSDAGDESYIALMMNNGGLLGVADLPADGDNHPSYPLCEISICNRSYTKYANKCVSETPIESITVGQFQDCADSCTRKTWCRSFDVIRSTSTCKLFTWVTSDSSQFSMASAGTDCVHYDTEP